MVSLSLSGTLLSRLSIDHLLSALCRCAGLSFVDSASRFPRGVLELANPGPARWSTSHSSLSFSPGSHHLLLLSAMSLADFVFGAVAVPLAAVWSIAAKPSLGVLRAGKVCPPAVDLLAAKEDLSGRVMIVTGANTGK